MLEGDRFEVLDITTRPDSEYVGMRFQELPIRGALIGAIVRDGKAIFPHGDDVLAAGRPRDHLHRVAARARGREGAVSAPRSAEPQRAAGSWRSTSRGALNARRHAHRVPQPRRRSSRPAFALGYGEPVWPFLGAGAIAGGAGLGARARDAAASTGSASARASSSSR